MAEQRFYVSPVHQAVAGNKRSSHWCGFPCYPGFHKQGPRGPLRMPCLLQQTSLSVMRNSFAVCIRDAHCHDCSAVIVNNSSASKCTTNVPFHPWTAWKSSFPLSSSLLPLLWAPFAPLIWAKYCCFCIPKLLLLFVSRIQFGWRTVLFVPMMSKAISIALSLHEQEAVACALLKTKIWDAF